MIFASYYQITINFRYMRLSALTLSRGLWKEDPSDDKSGSLTGSGAARATAATLHNRQNPLGG